MPRVRRDRDSPGATVRAGKAIRDAAAIRAASAVPCTQCGHELGQHYELQREVFELVDGAITMTINPAYEPLVFHCRHDGCDCKIGPS